jgi:hypothetical protein
VSRRGSRDVIGRVGDIIGSAFVIVVAGNFPDRRRKISPHYQRTRSRNRRLGTRARPGTVETRSRTLFTGAALWRRVSSDGAVLGARDESGRRAETGTELPEEGLGRGAVTLRTTKVQVGKVERAAVVVHPSEGPQPINVKFVF